MSDQPDPDDESDVMPLSQSFHDYLSEVAGGGGASGGESSAGDYAYVPGEYSDDYDDDYDEDDDDEEEDEDLSLRDIPNEDAASDGRVPIEEEEEEGEEDAEEGEEAEHVGAEDGRFVTASERENVDDDEDERGVGTDYDEGEGEGDDDEEDEGDENRPMEDEGDEDRTMEDEGADAGKGDIYVSPEVEADEGNDQDKEEDPLMTLVHMVEEEEEGEKTLVYSASYGEDDDDEEEEGNGDIPLLLAEEDASGPIDEREVDLAYDLNDDVEAEAAEGGNEEDTGDRVDDEPDLEATDDTSSTVDVVEDEPVDVEAEEDVPLKVAPAVSESPPSIGASSSSISPQSSGSGEGASSSLPIAPKSPPASAGSEDKGETSGMLPSEETGDETSPITAGTPPEPEPAEEPPQEGNVTPPPHDGDAPIRDAVGMTTPETTSSAPIRSLQGHPPSPFSPLTRQAQRRAAAAREHQHGDDDGEEEQLSRQVGWKTEDDEAEREGGDQGAEVDDPGSSERLDVSLISCRKVSVLVRVKDPHGRNGGADQGAGEGIAATPSNDKAKRRRVEAADSAGTTEGAAALCLFPLVPERKRNAAMGGAFSPVTATMKAAYESETKDLVVVNPDAFGVMVPATVTMVTAKLVAEVANIASEDWARRYRFDDVLWPETTLLPDAGEPLDVGQQRPPQHVFHPHAALTALSSAMVDDAMTRRNSSVCFTLGDIGTGKTCTMFGSVASRPAARGTQIPMSESQCTSAENAAENLGLVGVTVWELLSRMARPTTSEEENEEETIRMPSFTLSMMEIVDEDNLRDMFRPRSKRGNKATSPPPQMRRYDLRGATITNLTELRIDSMDRLQEWMRKAFRSSSSDKGNRRGHVVVTIKVHHGDVDPEIRLNVVNDGTLIHLVDLASSEGADAASNDTPRSGAVGRGSPGHGAGSNDRRSTSVRKSLSGLSRVLRGLVVNDLQNPSKSLSYRECTLTQVIQRALDNETSRAVIVATVCPRRESYHRTLNTLNYVNRLLIRPGRTARSPYQVKERIVGQEGDSSNGEHIGETPSPRDASLPYKHRPLVLSPPGSDSQDNPTAASAASDTLMASFANSKSALLKNMLSDPRQRLGRLLAGEKRVPYDREEEHRSVPRDRGGESGVEYGYPSPQTSSADAATALKARMRSDDEVNDGSEDAAAHDGVHEPHPFYPLNNVPGMGAEETPAPEHSKNLAAGDDPHGHSGNFPEARQRPNVEPVREGANPKEGADDDDDDKEVTQPDPPVAVPSDKSLLSEIDELRSFANQSASEIEKRVSEIDIQGGALAELSGDATSPSVGMAGNEDWSPSERKAGTPRHSPRSMKHQPKSARSPDQHQGRGFDSEEQDADASDASGKAQDSPKKLAPEAEEQRRTLEAAQEKLASLMLERNELQQEVRRLKVLLGNTSEESQQKVDSVKMHLNAMAEERDAAHDSALSLKQQLDIEEESNLDLRRELDVLHDKIAQSDFEKSTLADELDKLKRSYESVSSAEPQLRRRVEELSTEKKDAEDRAIAIEMSRDALSDELKASEEGHRALLDELQFVRNDANNSLNTMQKDLNRISDQKDAADTEVAAIQERLASAMNEREELAKEVGQLKSSSGKESLRMKAKLSAADDRAQSLQKRLDLEEEAKLDLRKEVDALQEKIVQADFDKSAMADELDRLKQSSESEASAAEAELRQRLDELSGKRKEAEDHAAAVENSKDQLRVELDRVSEQKKAADADVAAAQEKLAAARDEKRELEAEVRKLKSSSSPSSDRQKLESLQNELHDVEAEKKEAQERLDAAVSEKKGLEEALKKVNSSSASASEKLDELRKDLNTVMAEKDAAHDNANKLRKHLKASEERNRSLQAELDSVREFANDSVEMMQKKVHRLEKEMREAQEQLVSAMYEKKTMEEEMKKLTAESEDCFYSQKMEELQRDLGVATALKDDAQEKLVSALFEKQMTEEEIRKLKSSSSSDDAKKIDELERQLSVAMAEKNAAGDNVRAMEEELEKEKSVNGELRDKLCVLREEIVSAEKEKSGDGQMCSAPQTLMAQSQSQVDIVNAENEAMKLQLWPTKEETKAEGAGTNSSLLHSSEESNELIIMLRSGIHQMDQNEEFWVSSTASLKKLWESQATYRRLLELAIDAIKEGESEAVRMKNGFERKQQAYAEERTQLQVQITELKAKIEKTQADLIAAERRTEGAIRGEEILQEEVSNLRKVLREMDEGRKDLSARYEALVHSEKEAAKELEESKQASSTALAAISRLELSVNDLTKQKSILEATALEQQKSLTSQLQNETRKCEELHSLLDDMGVARSQMAQEIRELESKLAQAKAELSEEKEGLESALEKSRSEAVKLQSRLEDTERHLSQEKEKAEAELSESRAKASHLQGRLDDAHTKHREETNTLQRSVQITSEKEKAKRDMVAALQTELQSMSEKLEASEREKVGAIEAKDASASKLVVLQEALKARQSCDQENAELRHQLSHLHSVEASLNALREQMDTDEKTTSRTKAENAELKSSLRQCDEVIERMKDEVENLKMTTGEAIAREKEKRAKSISSLKQELSDERDENRRIRAGLEEELNSANRAIFALRDLKLQSPRKLQDEDGETKVREALKNAMSENRELELKVKELGDEKEALRSANPEERGTAWASPTSGMAQSGSENEDTFLSERERRLKSEEIAAALAARAKAGFEKKNAEIVDLKMALSSLADKKDAEIARLTAELASSRQGHEKASELASAISLKALEQRGGQRDWNAVVQSAEDSGNSMEVGDARDSYTTELERQRDEAKKEARRYKSIARKLQRELSHIDRHMLTAAHKEGANIGRLVGETPNHGVAYHTPGKVDSSSTPQS